MPLLLAQILSYIALAVKAAPEVEAVYTEGKKLITSLFAAGLITKEQQDDTMAWCDAHMAAVLAGQEPPEFSVE